MLSIGNLFKQDSDDLDDVDLEQLFEDRTNYHISLVNKYLDKITAIKDSRVDLAVIQKEKETHDESKFEEPEYTPYLYITYKYYLEDRNLKYNFDKKLNNEMLNATFHHVKSNKHHPEFWDDSATVEVINQEDGSKPGQLVDATRMPLSYIACMVADWCAVSEEKGTSPFDWADKNINKRWKFTQQQIDFIYDLLNKIWRR